MAQEPDYSRRAFLRGKLAPQPIENRPPWAVDSFVDACSRCTKCVEVCPENIIVLGLGDYPRVDFTRGECTFCAECVVVCPDGALDRAQQSQPWQLKAEVAESCMAKQGVVCRSCQDECEPEAIGFRLFSAGVSAPEIDTELCNGCGACVRVCPTASINMNKSTAMNSRGSS